METRQRDGLRFFLAMVVFLAAVAAMTSYSLWLLRSDAVHSSLNASALMARSFENFLTQTISATEFSTTNAANQGSARTSAAHMGAEFTQLLRQAPHLRSLSVLDAQGRIVVSSNPANLGLSVTTQDYLPLVQQGQAALRIGKPWLGRDFHETDASGATSLIPVLYPLEEADVLRHLVAGFNPDFFVNHMLQQVDEKVGVVEIFRLDGLLLMSTRFQGQGAMPHSDDVAKLKLGEREFGQFESTFNNGQVMLTAFRVSSLYPFVVVSHLRRDVALERWHTEVQAILWVVVPSVILVLVVAVVLYRRQRLFKAQQAESQRLQRINAACVFDNSREGIIIASAEGRIIDVNAAFTRITGYSRAEAIGKNPRMLSSGRQDKAFYQKMWQELKTNGHWSGELWNRRKDGEVYAEILTISAVSDSVGTVQQYVSVFTNITAMKIYQTELEHIARFDALTNLPNRILLADRLQQAMSQAQRRQSLVAVVFIDLDGFKAVNDTHGHEAGDLVLTTVSSRMRAALRDGDTLARNGGDEFVAVLVDFLCRDDAMPLLVRLLAAAAEPVAFADMRLQVSASLGVSFYEAQQATSMDDLLRQADAAMYQAKQAGKNRYAIYQAACASEMQKTLVST